MIHGFVDRGTSYHALVNYDSDSGFGLPGVFSLSIENVGHLVAYEAFNKIAELRVDTLLTHSMDVLRRGPVARALQRGRDAHTAAIKDSVPADVVVNPHTAWEATLCRLLLRIQGHRHGGALLLSSGGSMKGLNAKYRIDYSRLRTAQITRDIAYTIHHSTRRTIWDLLHGGAPSLARDLLLAYMRSLNALTDSRTELDGAIWLVSLLTRVDGLVLLTPDLDVRAFGVEITVDRKPKAVVLASNADPDPDDLKTVDYNLYGTRHRSMMRYCFASPGSIGFVVSQDGDVRGMTRVGDQIVVWENIRLRGHDFVEDTDARRVLDAALLTKVTKR